MQTIKISINQTPGRATFRIDGGAILAIIQREANNKLNIDMIFSGNACTGLDYNYSAYSYAINAVKKAIRNNFADYGLSVEFVSLQAAEIVNPNE